MIAAGSRASRGRIVTPLRGVREAGRVVRQHGARAPLRLVGGTRRAHTMPLDLAAGPSAVVSLTRKSRKENCRQQRDRVAALRGGHHAENGVVESGAGAPALGYGGGSGAFASGLSPSPLAAFPVPRSSVGSGPGAPILGSGGCSIAFALGLSPAPMTTFPTPASSNAACGFPALRFPIAFTPRVMWPIDRGALSAGDSGPGIVRTIRAAHIATAYSTSSSQIPGVRAGASGVAVSSSRPNP